jgi:CubicO group peptidase (beta-lactamase class C family)
MTDVRAEVGQFFNLPIRVQPFRWRRLWSKIEPVISLAKARGTSAAAVLVAAAWVASAQTPPGYDWTKLDRALEAHVGESRAEGGNLFSGITLMVLHGTPVVYNKGFGEQTVDSVLPIASATKMPSALVILKLVDLHVLDLDRPVGEYLKRAPGFLWPPDKRPITLRMLFNHTSGARAEDPCLSAVRGTLRGCAQQLATLPLEFAPGTKFAYGSGGMQVAGFVAEAATGRKWNDLFSEYVARPLKLTRFTYGRGDNPRIDGGAWSDAGDYLKLLEMFLGGCSFRGVRLLSAETCSLMGTDQVAGVEILRSPAGRLATGYSFGWWHSDSGFLASQREPRTHGPELSDPGAFGTTPWVDQGLGYAAVLLVRKNLLSGLELWNEIRPLIIEQIQKPATKL